jgi:DNA topoisomerase-2
VNSSDHGYDYLLSMPIWNLTMEKVESLLKEKLDKETQVKILIDQTILDLWRIDLDIFSEKWDEFETIINAL